MQNTLLSVNGSWFGFCSLVKWIKSKAKYTSCLIMPQNRHLTSQTFGHMTLPSFLLHLFFLTLPLLFYIVISASLSSPFCFIFFQYLWSFFSFSRYLLQSLLIYLPFALAAVLFGLFTRSLSVRSLISLCWSLWKSTSGEAASLQSLTSFAKTRQPTPTKTQIISGWTGRHMLRNRILG